MNDQQHDMMVGVAEAGVLKFSHKVYVSDKPVLDTDGRMREAPVGPVPMRIHHDILMSSGEDSQQTRLSSLDGDNDVPDVRQGQRSRGE